MGYGPEIIIDPNDRLVSSIGNWIDEPGGEDEGFVWSDDSAELFQNLSWHINLASLKKDFFLPINPAHSYRVTFDTLRPSDSPLGDFTMGIKCSDALAPSIGIPLAPLDVWISVESDFVFEEDFDNDAREIYFRLFSRDYTNQHFYIRNLSVREVLVGKIQYLPLMGVG